MYKLLYVLLVLVMISSCHSVSVNTEDIYQMGDDYYIEDEYIGMTIEEIIEKLGAPTYYERSRVINNKNTWGLESDPHYDKYFSDEELKNSVTIRVARWLPEDNPIRIYIWARLVENEWIIFSSLKYDSSRIEF